MSMRGFVVIFLLTLFIAACQSAGLRLWLTNRFHMKNGQSLLMQVLGKTAKIGELVFP